MSPFERELRKSTGHLPDKEFTQTILSKATNILKSKIELESQMLLENQNIGQALETMNHPKESKSNSSDELK